MTNTERKLVWAHKAWQLCALDKSKGQWLYAGSMAFCCKATENTITRDLPPKPWELTV